MDTFNFKKLHDVRRKFVQENAKRDHVVLNGEKNVLISAPHGVSQVRLGMLKFKEIGSLTTALYLQKSTNCFLIAKTKNNNDDANFDEHSNYRKELNRLVKKNNFKYLIDIHGLARSRECDVNLGINLGKNIETNLHIFETLKTMLENSGFIVSVDNPFRAGSRTIAGGTKAKFPKTWTIQIEINSSITNYVENFEKYKKLLIVFKNWINSL